MRANELSETKILGYYWQWRGRGCVAGERFNSLITLAREEGRFEGSMTLAAR